MISGVARLGVVGTCGYVPTKRNTRVGQILTRVERPHPHYGSGSILRTVKLEIHRTRSEIPRFTRSAWSSLHPVEEGRVGQ